MHCARWRAGAHFEKLGARWPQNCCSEACCPKIAALPAPKRTPSCCREQGSRDSRCRHSVPKLHKHLVQLAQLQVLSAAGAFLLRAHSLRQALPAVDVPAGSTGRLHIKCWRQTCGQWLKTCPSACRRHCHSSGTHAAQEEACIDSGSCQRCRRCSPPNPPRPLSSRTRRARWPSPGCCCRP